MSIVTDIKSGSEKAFTEAYHQRHQKLFWYFIKKTKSTETATELVQVVFIKLWNFRHTLAEDVDLDPQMFTIARTSLIDFLRQSSVQKSRVVYLVQDDIASPTMAPDDRFELEDYFKAATEAMPPIRKKVFTLSRLQGFSYREIAQQLSISINTVEDHMAKAIKQIKTLTSLFW